MDSPASAPSTSSRRPLLLAVAGCVVLLAGYAWFLRLHIAPYAGGSDSSGYLNSAALLLSGRFDAPVPTLPGRAGRMIPPAAHQPLGFAMRPGSARMFPSYPLGVPLHLAAFSWPLGLDWAAIPLNICSALAGGALLYLLARRLALPRPLALFGVAMLLLCPLYLFAALQPMSDLLALVWTLAVLYAALRARAQPGWAWFCGVAIAVAVFVRPSNLLVAVPVILALGTAWRRYLWVGLGGLPGALLLAWYNRLAYGNPFTTGYGDVWEIFRLEYLPHNLAHFAVWIPALLTPFVLAALAAPFLRAARQRACVVLGSWAVLLIGFYVFYYHSGETWWYLRFILPAFPVLILAALVTLHAFTVHARRRALIWGLLLAGVLAWEIRLTEYFQLRTNKSGEATYPNSADWARDHLPPDAVIFCMQVSGAFFYYTHFPLVRWDRQDLAPLLRVLHQEHQPVYAVLFDFEEPQARQTMGGSWTKIGRIKQATVWRVDAAPAGP